MTPILKRLALWDVAGGALSASLLALDRAAVAATAADPVICLRAGQLLAVAGWLGAWARFGPFLAARSRRWGLVATFATGWLAALGPVASTLVLTLPDAPDSRTAWLTLGGGAVAEAALLSTLAACLFETTRRPRALVVWFLALAWIVPALVGGTFATPPDATQDARTPTSVLSELFLPMSIAFAALLGALWAARPRFGTQ